MPALDALLGSLQVRVLVAQRVQPGADWHVPELVLPFNKIYFVHAGSGGHLLESGELRFRAGQACLIAARTLQRKVWRDETPLDLTYVHFDARVLGLVDLFDVLPCPAPFDLSGDPETQALLAQLAAEYAARSGATPYRALALNGMLNLILARLLRRAAELDAGAPAGEVVLRGDGDRVGRVLQFVAERFAEPLTLEDLAGVVHLHPTYFSNTFRKATGQAPMAYLQRFRVERAKGLLATGDLAVSEVAARVGFRDPYHFSRVFKKLVGVSPKAYHESAHRKVGAD
ncbi:MAG: AraC family transcriptional regulator [Planctomycetota bacterium]|nr:AraC family transcriptional regulator [Planctomycetota bacterium]